ncbi:MAG: hypothetical protein JW902_15115, partial [Syntrophaceae bacterium]|nr:hypothetical protein [Syntrophaceae bacterium]
WVVGNLAVGADAAAGSGYTIKVRLQDEQPSDVSNGPFTIGIPAEGGIKITQPTSMWSFSAGGNMTIMWRTTGSPGPLDLDLVNRDNPVPIPIQRGQAPEQSGIKWVIPDDLPDGMYCVSIKATGGVSTQSGYFRINAKVSRLAVQEPIRGVVRLKGNDCEISWNSQNVADKKVRIRLLPASGAAPGGAVIIQENAENREGRNRVAWNIPDSVADGKYTIAVETHDGTLSGRSGEFDIAANRTCDLAITAAEFCSGELKVTVQNPGDHYYGKITIMLIYDMFGRNRVSIPLIVEPNFILFSGKSLELSAKNSVTRNTVQTCSMNYSLELVPDKDHADRNQANNRFMGVAFKDCNVRACDKPDIWFEKVWTQKKYYNSALQAGQNVQIKADLRETGSVHTYFSVRVDIYYHRGQFDPWSHVTSNIWRFKEFDKKELSFTFTPAERGYFVFEWKADEYNDVEERDENNNQKKDSEFIWERR